MLRSSVLAVGILFFSSASAQVFSWAKPINATAARGMAVTTDTGGNVYVCGNVAGVSDFDPGTGQAISEVNFGTANVFLMKYDAQGNYLWHVALSNTGQAIAKCLAIDGNGDVVMAGRFESSITFGPGANGTITSNGGNDCFIAKYTSGGQLVWVRSFGSTAGDELHGLTLDASNNIIVSGSFRLTVDFDPGPGTTTLMSMGGTDGFVAKYGPNGAFQWVRGMQGTGNAQFWSVAADTNGDIHALGHFAGTVNVASLSQITSSGLSDAVLCRFTSTGTAMWRQPFGGVGNVTTERILNDGAGHLYIMGTFSGMANIDPGSNNIGVTSVGNNNMFFAKLLTNGNALWGYGIPAVNHFEGVGDLAVDDEGNVYVCGAHNVEIDLDPGPGQAIHPAPAGSGHDLFIAQYDAAGLFQWSRAITTEGGFDTANDIAVDANGNVIVTGSYGLSAEFDTVDPAGSLMHTSSQSGYTAKYAPDLGTAVAPGRTSATDLLLFPNPADGELFVRMATGELPQALELADATGRILMQRTGAMTGPINVGSLPPGHYHLRLLIDGTWQVRAFTVLR